MTASRADFSLASYHTELPLLSDRTSLFGMMMKNESAVFSLAPTVVFFCALLSARQE